MTDPVSCIQWARLVQVAEAHDIEFTVCEDPLGEPYKVDHRARVIHIDPNLTAGQDGYDAFAAGLAELIHDNVHLLVRRTFANPFPWASGGT